MLVKFILLAHLYPMLYLIKYFQIHSDFNMLIFVILHLFLLKLEDTWFEENSLEFCQNTEMMWQILMNLNEQILNVFACLASSPELFWYHLSNRI